jgi:hypothetical protein
MPRATIRTAVYNLLLTLVPGTFGKIAKYPLDAQLDEIAASDFPVAEISFDGMPSEFLTNHEYLNFYDFMIVVMLDMANLKIGDCEQSMDAIHDTLINLIATHQTLNGAVDIGVVPTAARGMVIEWKSRKLYCTPFAFKCRQSIDTD